MIELMIAMVIGLVLVAGVIEIFISSNASYRLTDGLSQVQKKGRFATAFLNRDIRMAGFMGCGGGSPQDVQNTLNNAGDFLANFQYGITGFDAQSAGDWSPAEPAALSELGHPPIPHTDIIAVRTVTDTPVQLTDTMQNNGAVLDVNNLGSSGLAVGDVVIVTDCSAAAVFQITELLKSSKIQHNPGNTNPSPGNSTQKFNQVFRIGSNVQKISTISYFIASRGKNTDCSKGDCGLWQKVGTDTEQELVSGVTNIQVLYGADTDGDKTPNRYVTASDVVNWDNVVSVKIALLVESEDAAISASGPAPSFTLLDQTVKPADNLLRLRKVFRTTVAIRNQVL